MDLVTTKEVVEPINFQTIQPNGQILTETDMEIIKTEPIQMLSLQTQHNGRMLMEMVMEITQLEDKLMRLLTMQPNG